MSAWRLCAVALAFLVGCGTSDAARPLLSQDDRGEINCVVYDDFVPADQVTVHGDLSESDRALVDWALGRFLEVELDLPGQFELSFDPTRAACFGAVGRCRINPDEIPEVTVCEPVALDETQYHRKLTLLHEMAHMWHGGFGTGDRWPEAAAIVGGVDNDREAPWPERSEERVADTISWGLSDQVYRPARGTQPCDVMYRQFEELTGYAPLPPIDPECVPEPDGS